MGNVMLNLGYITAPQKDHIDFLDNLGQLLHKNNPQWTKPQYGHIANGDETQNIVAEYQRQKQSGQKFDPSIDQKIAQFEGDGADPQFKLGIKGETPGADIERAGGPVSNSLTVQGDLRANLKEMERLGTNPDTLPSEQIGDLIRKSADAKGLNYPAKQEHAGVGEYRDYCEYLLHQSLSPERNSDQLAEFSRQTSLPEPLHTPIQERPVA